MALFNIDLAEVHGYDSLDFLSRLGRLESQGHRVNISVRNPKDVRWLVEQIADDERKGNRRAIVIRLTIGVIAATAMVSFGLLGLLT